MCQHERLTHELCERRQWKSRYLGRKEILMVIKEGVNGLLKLGSDATIKKLVDGRRQSK